MSNGLQLTTGQTPGSFATSGPSAGTSAFDLGSFITGIFGGSPSSAGQRTIADPTAASDSYNACLDALCKQKIFGICLDFEALIKCSEGGGVSGGEAGGRAGQTATHEACLPLVTFPGGGRIYNPICGIKWSDYIIPGIIIIVALVLVLTASFGFLAGPILTPGRQAEG